MEIFKHIEGFPDYRVSNLGNFEKKLPNNNWKRLETFTTSHRTIILRKNDKNYTFAAHRLVAITFLGMPPEGKSIIRHLNGIPCDNRIENLAWGTPKENGEDRHKHTESSFQFLKKAYINNIELAKFKKDRSRNRKGYRTILSNKLYEFFEKTGIPKRTFARRLKLTNATIYNYLNNGHFPNAQIASRINKETNGFIKMSDMSYSDATGIT